jgi:CubicO group peptidase (beta-lactamase class C family)
VSRSLEILTGLARRHPIFAPYTTPTYIGNAAFVLIGLVIEAVTEKGYSTVLRDDVLMPLGMTRTFARTPDASAGSNNVVIDPVIWDWDFGLEVP